jgi:hypothetical protein
LTGFCLTANPGMAGAAYGFAGMGPYSGGQPEYLRVLLPGAPYSARSNELLLVPLAPTNAVIGKVNSISVNGATFLYCENLICRIYGSS